MSQSAALSDRVVASSASTPIRLGSVVPVDSDGADRERSRPRLGLLPRPSGERFRIQDQLHNWCSPQMQGVRRLIAKAAGIDVTVLITGETGTGKEIAARALHQLGRRHAGPFVKVNCAAVARELLESELFGHERGSFTGAHQLKIGKFEAAHRGTIFLDEIGDLDLALQVKLLHVLEDGAFSRVGGRSDIDVDVRVVAATNQDLEAAVAAGQFREDLFYRLNVIRVALPPLRERQEDIPALVRHFVERYSAMFGREPFVLAPAAMERLVRHDFPGNVRELENLVKRMIVLDDPDLRLAAPAGRSPVARNAAGRPASSLREVSRKAAQAAEHSAILKALEDTQWNRTRAAKLLNISYRSLLYKIKDAGIASRRRTRNLDD